MCFVSPKGSLDWPEEGSVDGPEEANRNGTCTAVTGIIYIYNIFKKKQ
jgi:hypothetical protein